MSTLSAAPTSLVCLLSPCLLLPAERVELLAEATRQRPDARRTDRPGWRVIDEQQFLGPARFWYSLDGEVRERFHQTLTARVRDVADRPLRPVQSNYLYYQIGDYLGLHHDQARCPYTVIALLDGQAEPLCMHPELVGVAPGELAALVEPGGHCGGTELSLDNGPLFFTGGILPHHRTPHKTAEPITIVTFCFANEPE